MTVSLLKVPSKAIPIEPLEIKITFQNGESRSYPSSVFRKLNISLNLTKLNTTPELFELLINLQKKCLHEVAGEWIYENPYFYEEIEDLIQQLGLSNSFSFLKDELSFITLEQADTILRLYYNKEEMIERREADTTVRIKSEAPFLVKKASQVVSRMHLGAAFYIVFANLNNKRIVATRKLERVNAKLLQSLPPLQNARLQETASRLQSIIEHLQKQIAELDKSGYPDLSRADKDARTLPINVKFDKEIVTYPPALRNYLYECRFYSNDKPKESILTFDKRVHFDIYIKLIEGIPLRKQLRNHLCDDPYLFEKLTNLSRNFTQNLNLRIKEELRYISLDEARSIKASNVKSYLTEVANEILSAALYFVNEAEADKFFKERADLFDELQRLYKKLQKSKSDTNQTQYDKAKEQLDLMDSRLKYIPLSLVGILNYGRNVPQKRNECLEKITAYSEEIRKLINIPIHLNDYINLFEYYGFAVRLIKGKTVISFCGYNDYELDFEWNSPYEFETVLREIVQRVFPAAGNPTYESQYIPKTKEDKIRANPRLYMNLPRLITSEEITVPVSDTVKESATAFAAGKHSTKDIKVFIDANSWQNFGIKSDEINFVKKTVEGKIKLECLIRGFHFLINPITLRAHLRHHNRIRTDRIMKEEFMKAGKNQPS